MLDFFTYSSLKDDYKGFADPMVVITVDGESIRGNKSGVSVSDVEVDLTCGFEAGQAAFSLYDCYDLIKSTFEYDKIKKFIILGSTVVVALGYSNVTREVFRGVIVRVEFVIDDSAAPHVRVTCMDVKGIMMANHYHKALKAESYSGAVKEIFQQELYMEMTDMTGTGKAAPPKIITKLSVSDTPDVFDVNTGTTDKSIEMVGESDYEFVVRAAKKFNYEFYCIGGQVLFREARGDGTTLLSFNNSCNIFNMNVTYDITGLVGSVKVRGLDVGKAKVVENSAKNRNKISAKSQAKSIISGSEYVYVDPTVTDKLEAKRRSNYILDNMSFRFGNLDLEIMGLPEVIPGRFIEVTDLGTAVSNSFYVTSVHHMMDETGRYTTRIMGKAQSLATDLASLL